jgi:hypothetical protein
MDGTAGTIIVGAGPVGLAMSRCLRNRPRFQTAADARTDLTSEAVTHDAISRTDSALNTALDCGPMTPPERRKASSVSLSILSGAALPDVCKQWLAHAVPPHGGQHKEAQQ